MLLQYGNATGPPGAARHLPINGEDKRLHLLQSERHLLERRFGRAAPRRAGAPGSAQGRGRHDEVAAVFARPTPDVPGRHRHGGTARADDAGPRGGRRHRACRRSGHRELRRLFDSLPRAMAAPDDLDIRTENQLAAWFSFTLPGASASGLSHVMGKQIGARHGIPHGVTSCLLLPHVMRYLGRTIPDRMQLLAQATGVDPADRIEELIASLGLPQHISQFDVGQAALRVAAEELAGPDPAAAPLGIYLAAV